MTIELTISVPDTLGKQLQKFRERLPEILERGMRDLLVDTTQEFRDEDTIMELLASRPAPEQVLALKPSASLQTRMRDLLSQNKTNELSFEEETELERYLMLEHLVRLAKAHAYKQLMVQS